MTDVLLVRHGETSWNREGRIQGWAPVSLTDRGQRQAHDVGAHLRDNYEVKRVVASDLKRSCETANTIAAKVGVDMEIDERWRERDFGVYQGLKSESFFEHYPDMDLLEAGTRAAKATPESGENWFGVEGRVLDAWDSLIDESKTTVVVTHVNPIRLVLKELKGMDIVDGLVRQSFSNCSVTRVDTSGDPEVLLEDDTSFLE